MWTYLLLGLLIGTCLLFFFVYQIHRNEMDALRRRLSGIQQEESRIFNFLHGLGEAFTGQLNTKDLSRLIVLGAMDVMNAGGGALYLVDHKLKRLLPVHLSEGCPPLVPIPDHVLTHTGNREAAIESFLRLHSVPFGEGLIGEAFSENETRLVTGPHDNPIRGESARESPRAASAIVSPLIYGGETLGVLCVCNDRESPPFKESDKEVFIPIVEQSAFALYTAKIYSEAGEKRRLDNDLRTAREIQGILLPDSAPHQPGYEIAGRTLPARLVSGDYFDYIPIDEDRLGIVIADVSGKGVPASLIMAMCRSVLRSQAAGATSPSAVLSQVNRQLYPDMKEDMFISIAYLILNHRETSLTLCRAGHDAPLLFSNSDGSITRLNPRGMAIGIDSGDVFDRVCTDFTVNLEPDDCLVLYTDGVTEAVDRNGMEFGIGRLKQSILAGSREGAKAIVTQVIDDLREFTGDQDQYDDITLIAIRKE